MITAGAFLLHFHRLVPPAPLTVSVKRLTGILNKELGKMLLILIA
jgi:hypothetical protein